ncbi:MAG: acyltransferase [Ignavibacteriales bacterium]|nr:acyltransferase [Ignavibacteriales bacterium]
MKSIFYYLRRFNERAKSEYPISLTQAILIFIVNKLERIFYAFTTLYGKIKLILWGASIGRNFKLHGSLVLNNYGRIIIEDNVRINSVHYYVGGGNQGTILRIGAQGTFIMKDGSGMTNTAVHCFNSITICEGAMIGGGCLLMDNDFHQTNTFNRITKSGNISNAPIVIGKNAFIGGMSIIRRGVTIGEGSVIGTGSLVTKSVPPYEIWAGVPAKFIKKIERDS